MLAKDGFEDNYTIVTEKHTFTAPFVNAEETQYLCIEDQLHQRPSSAGAGRCAVLRPRDR